MSEMSIISSLSYNKNNNSFSNISLNNSLMDNINNSIIMSSIDSDPFERTILGESIKKLINLFKYVGIYINPHDRISKISYLHSFLMGIICCLALPYYYYVYILTGSWSNVSTFFYFLFGNLTPPVMWFSFHVLFKDKRFYTLLKEYSDDNFFISDDYLYLSNLINNSNIATLSIVSSYFFWLYLNIQYLDINWAIYFAFIGVSFIVRLIVPFFR